MPRAIDEELQEGLVRRFRDNEVIPEWDVAKNSQDDLNRRFYCPRIDFAVGPFNIDAQLNQNNNRITGEYQRHLQFFKHVKERNHEEWREIRTNENPRCFIAIEVEKSGSRKHRIGSIINASAIGKIGILVAFDEANFRGLNRIKSYLDFIQRVEKTNYYPQNVLIIRRDDFLELL